MPTSLVGLVLFVVLLAPGMVYVRRRERQQAATPVSALRETTTIVLASVTCELLVAGLLAVARVVWPAGTPDVGALVRDPASAVRAGYASLTLWAVGLVASASLVALVAAAVNLPARIGGLVRRMRWLAWLVVPPTEGITPSAVWWNLLYARYPAASVHVGCVLDDGSYVDGWLSEFDPSPVASPDRELVLATPIRYRPPGADAGYQLPGQDDELIVQSANRALSGRGAWSSRSPQPAWRGTLAHRTDAGPTGKQDLQPVEQLPQAQADAAGFGWRSRSRVRKPCATETRVTWWCQPAQERPSKWSSPSAPLSSR
jgi:Family of unknown function (DUF6338)